MHKQNRMIKLVSRSLAHAARSASSHGDSKQLRNASLVLVLASLIAASPAKADSLTTDSVLITRHSNKAADYYEKGNFNSAKEEYLAVIGFAPNAVEPYEGLLSCAKQTQDWRQVAFAAEKIASLSPERKPVYEFDYGTALYHLNRFDEAIPHLKSALVTADVPAPMFKPIKLDASSGSNASRVAPSDSAPSEVGASSSGGSARTTTQMERDEQNNKVTSDSDVDWSKLENFENAIRSESILLVEYLGRDKTKDLRYNSPPGTRWRVEKILKGPPIGRDPSVRYDFHTLSEKDAPPGWRFNESMMPVKGSRWILFIEFSLPEGKERLLHTYGGSYGRQPATEENLDKLDRLLDSHNMRVQGL